MIGFLSGIVKSVSGSKAILNVGGVGYTVSLPTNHGLTPNQPAQLYIHTHVREDEISLYGFSQESSLDLFEKLLGVSGVGPKSALTILSAAAPDHIKQAIIGSNLAFFTAISGIGKKGAQKIILELKPKLGRGQADLANLEGNSELDQALTNLGFSKNEIVSVISRIDQTEELGLQIKKALKLLRS